jgi:cholesterol oxidase
MGMDSADGVMSLKKGQIHVHWDSTKSMEMFAEMEQGLKALSGALGGKYITSPIWLWPARKLLTAHPLGGCRMADSKENGVVNSFGQVWGYPNLYIADGSIVPTPLSVNPSMTIAALAERIAEQMVNVS